MNEIAKYFSVPVLKQALIRHIQVATNTFNGTVKIKTPLDCQIFCQSPVFQVSDGSHYIDCELSDSALNSLTKAGRLIGLIDLKGILVSIPKYAFMLRGRKRYILVIEDLSVIKIDKLSIIGLPQAYYLDKDICDYVNMHQQFIEKGELVEYIDPLPSVDIIIAGSSQKFPTIINLEMQKRREDGASQSSMSKFLDLNDEDLKNLLNSPELFNSDSKHTLQTVNEEAKAGMVIRFGEKESYKEPETVSTKATRQKKDLLEMISDRNTQMKAAQKSVAHNPPQKAPEGGKKRALKLQELAKFAKWRDFQNEAKGLKKPDAELEQNTHPHNKDGAHKKQIEFTMHEKDIELGYNPDSLGGVDDADLEDAVAEIEPSFKQKIHDFNEDQHHN